MIIVNGKKIIPIIIFRNSITSKFSKKKQAKINAAASRKNIAATTIIISVIVTKTKN